MKRRSAIMACAAAASAPRLAGAQAADALTIALVPVENAAQAYFADELGLFAKARIAADLQPLSNGGAIASAVAAGAADIGFATVIPIALAHEKGLPLQFVAAGYVSNDKLPTSAMLVLPDAPIHRGADLEGKLAATNGLATINEYVPRAWIDANGGDSDRVRFAEMPFSGMPSALAAGRVDAVYIAEPFATVAKAHARVLFYGTAVTRDGELLGGWFADTAWARAHADLVRRFDGAMRQASAWANANPAACATILAKRLRIDPALAASINRTTFAEGLNPARMQSQVELAARYAKFRAFPANELIFRP
jgi:NitT/TauT family transport system substrate-binding protein